MNNIFIINTHQPYPFSPGKLSATLVEMAQAILTEKGSHVRITRMNDAYTPAEEVEKHIWADAIILQIPVNWMGVPWPFKRYMDHVYSAGLEGQLCNGDGRTRKDARRQYGTGGVLQGKKYMLSLTFNAPREAFDDTGQWFFQGKSVDDLFLPMHLNFKFFGMEPLPTFACFDVLKNPAVDNDLQHWRRHLEAHFSAP